MRTMRLMFVAACTSALVILACGDSTFSGGNETNADAGDGGNGTTDADSEAGGPDSSTNDGGCTPSADLCDDFEGASFPASVWSLSQALPGVIGLSSDKSQSPTHSMQLLSDSDGGNGSSGSAFLAHTFGGKLLGIDCAFSLWIGVIPVGPPNTIVSLNLQPNTGSGVSSMQLDLTTSSLGTSLNGSGFPSDGGAEFGSTILASALPTNRWLRLEIIDDYDTARAKLLLDGSPVEEVGTVQSVMDDNGVLLQLGMKDNFAATSYFIDDVVCTARR